jgi:hypothetical protein
MQPASGDHHQLVMTNVISRSVSKAKEDVKINHKGFAMRGIPAGLCTNVFGVAALH